MKKTPLNEAIDKEAHKREIDTSESSGLSGKDITEMRDMKSLSLLYGFDGDGFDGNSDKVLPVYDWVKDALGSDGGEEVVLFIMSIINSEFTDVKGGKALAEKVYQWFSLEESMEGLKDEIENLKTRQRMLT